MTTPLLEIADLSITLPAGSDRPLAVENASLGVAAGEITCIVGESGSGKSMLARAILDILPGPDIAVSQGTIRLRGQELVGIGPARMRKLRGARISMIFQEPMTALNPLLRVGDQIAEVLETHTDMPRRDRQAKTLAMLDDVHLPDPAGTARAWPHQLSGGQRQRVMIAMALVMAPDLIVADEPTTALDVTTQAQILELIAGLQRKKGIGILFITHDFGVVAEIADRIVVMRHGKVVESGDRAGVLNAPCHPYTRALLDMVPGLVPPAPRDMRDINAAPVLEATGLGKTFRTGGGIFGIGARTVAAVRDVSFRLGRAETLGIIGESGSGKSTLARLIVRLVKADTGQVTLDGVDCLALAGLAAVRARIQMVFQDPFASLNPRQKVGRIIAEGLRVRGIHGVAANRRVRDMLALVELPASAADRFPHEFSGGQRQRIGIARALAVEPEILIADEVVSALDVSVQGQILDLLRAIRERLGLSMLFITHDLCVAAQVCDRIMVMKSGRVVESGPARAIIETPRHDYTRALMASVPGRHWMQDRASPPGRPCRP